MIDDLSCEDLDSFFFCKGSCLGGDLNVKREQSGEFFVLTLSTGLGRFHALKDVLLMHWTDVDCRHWDLHVVKVLQKGLK